MSESKEIENKASVPTSDDKKSETVDTPTTVSGESSTTTHNPSKGKGKQKAQEHEDTMTKTKNDTATGSDGDKAAEAIQKISIADLLAELSSSSSGGKTPKDMSSHKFWKTQPVPRFDEQSKPKEDGPIKFIDPDKVSKEPDPLLGGFEWTTLDLTDDKELQELWDLLTYHYVEDDDAMFRFRYSKPFLHWYGLPYDSRF